jgi:hypothetical protein
VKIISIVSSSTDSVDILIGLSLALSVFVLFPLAPEGEGARVVSESPD